MVENEDEEAVLRACSEWVIARSLPPGEVSYELLDPDTEQPAAVLDLAWPKGLQEGLSQPACVLIGEETEVEEAANGCGFRFFTDIDAFKEYVLREVLAALPEAIGR